MSSNLLPTRPSCATLSFMSSSLFWYWPPLLDKPHHYITTIFQSTLIIQSCQEACHMLGIFYRLRPSPLPWGVGASYVPPLDFTSLCKSCKSSGIYIWKTCHDNRREVRGSWPCSGWQWYILHVSEWILSWGCFGLSLYLGTLRLGIHSLGV